jgi:hypothetical protein
MGDNRVSVLSAVGCRQIDAGDEFYVVESSDGTAAVRCNASDETWYLTCRGNTWIGEIGNCTAGGRSPLSIVNDQRAQKPSISPPFMRNAMSCPAPESGGYTLVHT